MLIPDPVQVDPRRWEGALRQLELDGEDYEPLEPNRALMRLLAEREVPTLDLSPTFIEAVRVGSPLYFQVDRHWTIEGHELAGRQLADFLRQQEWACRGVGEVA